MRSFMTWFVLVTANFPGNLKFLTRLPLILSFSQFQVASGKPFDSKDYMAPTPSWAVYGSDEGGFDPDQSRYRKERHHRPKPMSS